MRCSLVPCIGTSNTPPRGRRLVAWVLLALVASACGGGGGGDGGQGPSHTAGLDPNVPPVEGGGWWEPSPAVTWQWQLLGTPNTAYDVDLYDLDLFDTPPAVIAELHTRGIRVIAYFSAGSAESWRPDYGDYAERDLGLPLEGWEGERWVDTTSVTVWAIVLARLDLAVQKGFDGVEPDNVDGYENDTGFDLTQADALAFNRNLANEAHRRGLTVLLKNTGGLAESLVAYYDLALTEECHLYDECALYQPFLSAGKPVLNAEYADSLAAAQALAVTVCPDAAAQGLRTLILPLDLDDAFRETCP